MVGWRKLLSTDLSPARELVKDEKACILSITAPKQLAALPAVKTMKAMGNKTVYPLGLGFSSAKGGAMVSLTAIKNTEDF